MAAKIDSHHHFWKYTTEAFGWIDDSMASLRRDFMPADLEATIRETGVDGVVSVQARQSLEETAFLLNLADQNPFICGVVGWVPLISESVGDAIRQFSGNPKLRSFRHILQGEADERYMLRDDFNRGIALLKEFNLAYDILIFERHLPQTIEFVDRHPSQVFVLDHIAKPQIHANLREPWATQMKELAKRENVYCKVSGMVTEADFKTWTEAQMQPYWETVLGAFGPKRLMFGSDWPVCLAAASYQRWYSLVQQFTASLSSSEQAEIFGETAIRAYQLKSPL